MAVEGPGAGRPAAYSSVGAAAEGTPSPLGEASSAASKRAQYAEKLRQRTGGSITADGAIAPPAGLNRPRGGPENPNVRPVDQEAMFRFQHGARDLLQYLDMRGIARVLLPSPGVETDDAAHEEAAMLTKALQLLGVHGALELGATSELMVVSDDAALIRGAKKVRIFSCHYYRRVPGAAKSLPSDFRAEKLAEVQSAIEELNGVTFRDPDTEIRTQFGVSVT